MILTVRAVAGARRNAIEWIDATTVKISVTVAPEKGKANSAILALLAKHLGVSKSQLQLKRGMLSRIKQIHIPKNAKRAD